MDLLTNTRVRYDFKSINGKTKADLLRMIDVADVVSFDLFDTLIMRKVYSYTDIFELMDVSLKSKGINIQNFSVLRLAIEKELSVNKAPTIDEIYTELLRRMDETSVSANLLSEIEWNLDSATFIPREGMKDIFEYALEKGKRVVVTTDCYYSSTQLKVILDKFSYAGYEKIFVSCEYGVSKTQTLFNEVSSEHPGEIVIHVGDDDVADIKAADKVGIDSFKIFSGRELFETLGEFGTAEHSLSVADHVKCGLFISNIFSNPFQFENSDRKVTVKNTADI